MSVSIRDKTTGDWVQVAGGTRMWVGTKAALRAALDAGELVDGTAVMVTDDYEETPTLDYYIIPVNNSIPGITITKRDGNPKGLYAIRNGNNIILNFSIIISGTYTGSQQWTPLFDWSDMLSHMLKDDEMLTDSGVPYFCHDIVDTSIIHLDGIMSGCMVYMYPNTFNNSIQGQIILTVSKA